MSETAEALAFGAMAIRKYFRDEDPNYRTLPDRVGGDEGENASRNN